MTVQRAHFLGVPVDLLGMKDVLEVIRAAMREKRRLYQVTLNVSTLIAMRQDRDFAEYVLDSDVITADGMGIVWGARLLGIPVPERVAGVDIMYETLGICAREGYRPYFLGATPTVLDSAVERAKREWPGLSLAGAHHGYFSQDEEPLIVESIVRTEPDCLFVGISSPMKERFCHRWNDAMSVPFVVGVGGSFDVLAGKTARAPRLMQQLGMEWVFRIYQEPRRMWWRYLSTNARFALTMLRAVVSRQAVPIEERQIPRKKAPTYQWR